MKKTIVTGGDGFIGRHLVKGLQEKGYLVEVVDIKSEGDVRDLPDLTRRFEGAEYVFHLAALPRVQYSIENPIKTHETNVDGTLNVLEAAKSAGVKKVINASSSSVYGECNLLPLVEEQKTCPVSPYALHKLISEQYCKLFNKVYGIDTISLRYFNVYGPGGSITDSYPLVIPLFLHQRKQGKPMTITGDGTQTRDFTHVKDIVRATILAAESPTFYHHSKVLNIGAGNNVSVNRIAELIGGPVEYIPARQEPKNTLADNTMAKTILGWKPEISIEDGIAELRREAGL